MTPSDHASDTLDILLLGATGRMGHAVSELIDQDDQLNLLARLSSASDRQSIDQRLSDRADAPVVLIDFSLPGVIESWLPLCIEHGIGIVSGVTGLTEADHQMLRKTGEQTAVLWGSNLSSGIALLADAISRISRWKTPETEVMLLDDHHRHKRDRPSGTALTLASAWLQPGVTQPLTGQGIEWTQTDEDQAIGTLGEFRFKVIRRGDTIGHHSLTISTGEETLTLDHQVTDRRVFARGALTAAHWLSKRDSGHYLFAEMFRLT